MAEQMLKAAEMKCTMGTLAGSGGLEIVKGTSQDVWERIKNLNVSFEDYKSIAGCACYLGVTEEFKNILSTFPVEREKIPAGFCPKLILDEGRCVRVDLKRDISYGEDGVKRPTPILFSADSANPYEVKPLKNIIANLTCNPAIIYNDFINNLNANTGN